MDANREDLEAQIDQWRSYLHGRQAVPAPDVEELEGRLRDQVAELVEVGLHSDEAFLVAVKRMGTLDAPSREFAREHSDRLWKQLVLAPGTEGESGGPARAEIFVVVALAVASALAFKVPELFGLKLVVDGVDDGVEFYVRNASLFVLPFLAGYFVWKRGWGAWVRWLVPPFAVAAVLANVYPFSPGGSTEVLAAIHLPIALWLVVGFAYVGGEWRSSSRRMDFVRFTGELFIYYVLIALGGGVLTGFTLAMFSFIGVNLEWLATSWLLPCGALGAVIVGGWLVEAKQSVIGNMAPVLTRVFTPLFALLLLAFLVTMVWTGTGINVERGVLIGFDLLLVLVLGLLLYAVSARDPEAQPDAFDALQLVLVVSALAVDVLALMAIAGRISEFGFSANRVAALGVNIILLVNLAWSAWLSYRFLRGRGSFSALERWQTTYLPVYAVWAAVVVMGFPPAFGYL
ncbi:MAG: hypothetical protein CL878_13635 [Dehalococcoidia bacterium]|nr:hypothetical protein [Dehalococcoidia bacterium]